MNDEYNKGYNSGGLFGNASHDRHKGWMDSNAERERERRATGAGQVVPTFVPTYTDRPSSVRSKSGRGGASSDASHHVTTDSRPVTGGVSKPGQSHAPTLSAIVKPMAVLGAVLGAGYQFVALPEHSWTAALGGSIAGALLGAMAGVALYVTIAIVRAALLILAWSIGVCVVLGLVGLVLGALFNG